jgi:hypothetical protein
VSANQGLLQSTDGRRLLAAQLFDSLGAGVGLVALPWLVLDAGGDASTAGLVAVFGLVPYVLFGLFAGVTGDRRSRRSVIIVAHSTQTICALAVPLWAIWGSTPEWLVLTVAFAVGIARTFADAAAFGAIAQIEECNDLIRFDFDAIGVFDPQYFLYAEDLDLWVKVRDASPDHEIFFYGGGHTRGTLGIDVDGVDVNGNVQLQVFTFGDDANGLSTGVPLNQWMHVAVTYDGNTSSAFGPETNRNNSGSGGK